MKRQNILLSFVANSFAAKVFVIVKNIILFWFLFIWPIWSHQHSQLRTTRCKRFVRSINFQNLQQKKDPEWLKTAVKICQKMSRNTICKKVVRSRQFEIQSQVASCPLRQFAKFTNKVVQDNNLYNLQKKLARTAIC